MTTTDTIRDFIAAAEQTLESIEALGAAARAFFETQETGESIVAALMAHGLDSGQTVALLGLLNTHVLGPQATQAQPPANVIDGCDFNRSDAEWHALGFAISSVSQHRRLWTKQTPGGTLTVMTRRRPTANTPHARHIQSQKK